MTFKIVLLAAASVGILGAPAGFADDTSNFAQFSVAAETSGFSPNYAPIAQFTNAFGNEERGRMKIAHSVVEERGIAFMQTYTNYLESVPVSTLARQDQLAYWLNTHNMLVIEAICEDARGRRKMANARGTADAPGEMWTAKRITVEGVELSIHDIEQNIILANFSDKPNVIFGLYQGTAGSPAFPASGFTGSNLDAELEAAGQDYVTSRKNGVKVRGTKAEIPAVYDWYSADLFGDDEAAGRAHLASFLDASAAAKLNAATEFKTRKFSYASDGFKVRQQRQSFSQGSTGGGSFGGGGGGGS